MKSKVAIAIMLASAAGGCITSQAMPLSPNQVRIDTRAGGLLFVNQTVPTTMREAATQTLRAGYTHFKLSQAGRPASAKPPRPRVPGDDTGAAAATCSGPHRAPPSP